MTYRTMLETRRSILVLDEYVSVCWSGTAISYYKNLGYESVGFRQRFLVKIDDLHTGSNEKVRCKCPLCGHEFYRHYYRVINGGHTLCHRCVNIIDLLGEEFGRYTVIAIDVDNIGSGREVAYWFCECECGEKSRVSSNALIRGEAKSCGCYHNDLMASMTGESNRAWKGGKITVECEWCGDKYEIVPARKHESRFCSRGCLAKWQSENMSGENSPLWDNDTTEEERVVGRRYPEYRQYIKDVLRRDQYTCQICGSTDDIEVHHMYSYKHHQKYRIDTEFGLSMCKCCHADFHSWNGGKRNPCIPSDLDRWLYETSCTVGY